MYDTPIPNNTYIKYKIFFYISKIFTICRRGVNIKSTSKSLNLIELAGNLKILFFIQKINNRSPQRLHGKTLFSINNL